MLKGGREEFWTKTQSLNILRCHWGTVTGCLGISLTTWVLTTWIYALWLSWETSHVLVTGHWQGLGSLFSCRQSLKRDSAKSCQLLLLSAAEKSNAWISEWGGLHSTPQHRLQSTPCTAWIHFFFLLKILGESLPGFWWTSFILFYF